ASVAVLGGIFLVVIEKRQASSVYCQCNAGPAWTSHLGASVMERRSAVRKRQTATNGRTPARCWSCRCRTLPRSHLRHGPAAEGCRLEFEGRRGSSSSCQ